MKNRTWDLRYLHLADHISLWSKDPSTKVGAIIVDENNRIVSTGYNGFPQNVPDNQGWLQDRETKLKYIVHAEANALLFAHRSLKNCVLYTYPFMPCSNCAGLIVQSGISRVVSIHNTCRRWKDSFSASKDIFNKAGIDLILYRFEDLDNEVKSTYSY